MNSRGMILGKVQVIRKSMMVVMAIDVKCLRVAGKVHHFVKNFKHLKYQPTAW